MSEPVRVLVLDTVMDLSLIHIYQLRGLCDPWRSYSRSDSQLQELIR